MKRRPYCCPKAVLWELKPSSYVKTFSCSNKFAQLLVTFVKALNRAFSHDVTAAILMFQNNETAAMLVFQASPVGAEFFSCVNNFVFSHKFVWMLAT